MSCRNPAGRRPPVAVRDAHACSMHVDRRRLETVQHLRVANGGASVARRRSCAGEASFIRPLIAALSVMMGFSSSSGLASPRLPPIEKAAKSSYASPRSFGPARDAAVRRLQTLNLTPRVGAAGGRIGLVPTPGALAKLPGLTPAPRRAAFTQTFNGGPARLPPPLGPPPSEELLEARRARAREKKREQAEDAERRAVELRAEKLEARERRDPNLTRGARVGCVPGTCAVV